MTCFRRVGSQLVIGVWPQTNENMRVAKRKLYRKVIRRIILERCQTVHVGGYPMDCFGELSNNSPQRIVQSTLFGGLSNRILSEIEQCVFKNKNLLF